MFDLQLTFGIISGIVSLSSGVPYIIDIFKGTTKPNAVSWFGWFVITAIASVAQFSSGASWSLIFVLGETLKVAVIFLLSLRFGVKEYTKIDKLCLTLGIIGIILWRLTEQPVLAIIFAVIADFVVAYPTILKTIYKPLTETAAAYILASIGGAFSLLSSKIIDPANLLYPGYLFVVNAFIGITIYIGQKRLKSK